MPPEETAISQGLNGSTSLVAAQECDCSETVSEEAFFFARSLDLLSVISLDGYFRRVNSVFTQTLGYSQAEFLARPFLDFVHPDDHCATLAEMENLNTGVPTLYFENRYRTKDGLYRWLAWTASPQVDRGVIYCVARDMTQQKQTEAALRESEERWQLALRGSNDGIWDWNVQTNQVFFSTRWKTMLGYEAHEIDNHLDEWAKRVHPDDLAWVTQAIQDHFAQKTPFYITEHRVLCKDGTYKWILDRGQAIWDEAGNALRMVGSHTDVTKQRELAAALKQANETLEQRVVERTADLERMNRNLHESEVRFRMAVNHLPDAFVIYDTQRRIQFVNAAGLTLTEGLIEDFLGRTDEEIYPSTVTDAYLPLLKRAVETKSYQTGECTITLPNRAPYTIVMQYVPLLDEQGEIQQILGLTHDITERKQAEEAVRRSEKQIRRILDGLFSFVGVMTPNGILIEANRTALAAAALHPEDVLGKPFAETYWWSYSIDVQNQLRAAIERATTGETVRYDVVVRIRDNQWITIDFTLVPIFAESGQVEYLIPSGIDITQRKQAEVALRESQAEVQRQLAEIETIYQSAPIGLNVLDTDLRFVRINQRLAEMNGLSVEAHMGRTVREVLPEIADAAEQILRPILATGESRLNVEITGETPAQPGMQRVWLESFLPLKEGDRIIGISTVCQEITERKRVEDERKQAEEALRRSEERYRMLFESMEDGFCVIEMLFDENNRPINYRFLETNPAFEQQTGLQQADGKTVRQLIPNLEAHWFETYGKVALTGEPIRFENGSDVMNRWFDVHAFRLGQPESRKVAVLFKDISDRKGIEIQREQLLQGEQTAREAAEHANQIKDEFLAVLSHELRTPLNPILGWAKLLQSPRVSAEKLQQGLSTIERNAKQQLQLIDELLDISGIIRGQLNLNFASVVLSEPITAALETVRLAAEAKAIQLEVCLNPTVEAVRGDVGRLQQVMWNLLSNAIKFTPTGGRVTVQLTQVDGDAQIQVSDTGKGIHPEFLPHVFELFRQQDSSTTRQFGGLGLGLAIARQVIEAHGGTITAASAGQGQGATFTVHLPMPMIKDWVRGSFLV